MHCATASDVDVNLMMIEKNMNYYELSGCFFLILHKAMFTHTIKCRYKKRRLKKFKFN